MRKGDHLSHRGLIAAIATLAAALSVFFVPVSARGALLGGTITGHVTDASSGQAIAGASVSAGGSSATTDSSGAYTITSVAMGSTSVTASASSHVSATRTAHVLPILGATVNFSLASNQGSLSGSVTDATTGAPLPGATVTLSSSSQSITTDSSGHYAFSQVSAGSQTVTASLTGYKSASASANVTAGGSATANLVLTRDSGLPAPGSTISWNGSSSYLLGANYAWWNYATDFGDGGWGKYTDWTTSIPGHFQTMAGQGVRVVRWWLFGDGRYAPDFNGDGTVSGLDNSVLSDIDQALQIAARNNIYILFTVMDGNMWANASYSGSVQMGGHSAIITDAATQQSFLDNALKPVLQHVAASPYAKYVIGYDLVNEPESQMDGTQGYWGGVNLAPSAVQSFVQRCASYVHNDGGGAYATVGSATPYYVGTWKNLGLDFYQIHYYPWMDFSNGAGSGLPTYASLGLDRPCIVGEFPTNDASYTLTDTNPLSARWYLDTIYNNGYAGALAWSFFTGDDASNWSSFQPVFTDWANSHASYVGPR